MTKVRIYDLSKIVGISNKELVDYLTLVKDASIKSHSSSIDQNTANQIIMEFRVMKKSGKTLREVLKEAAQKQKVRFEKERAEKLAQKAVEKKPEVKEPAPQKAPDPQVERQPEAKSEAKPAEQIKPAVHARPPVETRQPVRPHDRNREGSAVTPPTHVKAKQMPVPGQASGREKPVHRTPESKVSPESARKPEQAREKPPQRTERGEKDSQRKDFRPKNQFKPRTESKEGTPVIEVKQAAKAAPVPAGMEQEKNKSRKRRRRKPGGEAGSTVTGQSSALSMEEKPRPGKEVFIKKDDKKVKATPASRTRTFSYPTRDRRGRRRRGEGKPPEVTMKESTIKWMEIPDTITVGDLSKQLEISANELIKNLMNRGIMATINQTLNFDLAAQIVKKYGFRVEHKKVEKEEVEEEVEDPKLLSPRPPVVTVLGHVDHGKTSLLDCIRKTDVAGQESGGITQSIGAYTAMVDGRKIVFLDTPGHEAFTQMRARGAMVTDIAVLVVAADDGVMPQTVEAINHAKAAKVPIIVAINKVDKPESNPERVKQQLAEYDLIAEDWGGDIVTVPVSAKTKVGIDDLLEMILLVSEVQELKANPHKNAEGIIIESSMNVGLGPVATVVVQNGTLKVGDVVLVGREWGRVKAMLNDKGKRIKKALPSYPAEIIGLSGVPDAGDHLMVFDDEKEAKDLSEKLKEAVRTDRMQGSSRTSLEDLFKRMKDGETKTLNIIIKADVQGSLEALRHSLQRLSTPEVSINIIHGGVGTISKTDVMLANASNAIIIGFNVRPDPITKRLTEQEGIEIRLYRVIYHIIEDVKLAMVGLLEPEYQEVMMGRATVRAIFKISKLGVIAGSYITHGKLVRGSNARIIRDGVVVYEGKIGSLRRFKDDVKEVEENYECGIGIEKFGGMQSGDIIEAYSLQEVKRELSEPESSSGR